MTGAADGVAAAASAAAATQASARRAMNRSPFPPLVPTGTVAVTMTRSPFRMTNDE
jgi:hypothetical protein